VNTGYLFGERVFNMGLSLVVGIYVARYLGPNEFGLWQYANSLVALFTAIASLGTANIVIRDLVEQPSEKEGAILGTTFILMLGAGIATALLTIFTGLLINNETVTHWLIIIASVNLVLQAFNAFDYWFQSQVLAKYSVYARTIAQVIVSILKVLFIILSLNVIYFALTAVLAGVVRIIIWLLNYKRRQKDLNNWEFDVQYAKKLLLDAWPLILSGISVAIYMKIDQVMIKSMMNAGAVGNYAVAVRLSELWYFIPLGIASSVFPTIIRAKNVSQEHYHRRLQYLYDIMAGISIVIALPLTFLSTPLITFLFGAEYSMAGPVLSVHIWAGIFVFFGVARSKWIISENYQKYGMIFTGSGAITNILLNLWLIPTMGIMGAAWATVISQIIAAWLLGYFFDDIRISSKMIFKSIISSLLVYPVINSVRNVIKEAYE